MMVRIYSKPDCHLCDQAREVLERVRARIPFELVEEDIRASPTLLAAYRYDIPVVIFEGIATFKHRLREEEVEECLRRGTGGTHVAESKGQGK
ncbi:glutaredoxin family protein [Cystobacter fuscus]|nr:glutaredoxin family protein [Cystobacter fuscus]